MGGGAPDLVDIPGTSRKGAAVLAEWWPLFVEVGTTIYGLTRPRLVQAFVAYSSKSGRTHADGTGADGDGVPLDELPQWAQLARRYGAPACWPRGPKYGQPSLAYHFHLQLNTPESVAGRWQLDEVFSGGDGLTGGLSDYLSPTPPHTTAREGIEAMRAALAAHNTTQEDDDMKTFMMLKGKTEVYLTDGQTARWVRDEGVLRKYAQLGVEGTLPIRQTTHPDSKIVGRVVTPAGVAHNGVRVRVVDDPYLLGAIGAPLT